MIKPTPAQTKRYYFEDFQIGRVWEIDGPVLSAQEIIEFATRFDPQYFHVDESAAKGSPFGGLVASGWHTVGICMRLICEAYLLDSASLGSPGVDEVRWTKPVRPDDKLRLRMTVLEATPSRSKPDRGTVLHRWEVFNQHDEVVMKMQGYGMFLKRPV
jgi:acyl dehydratase